MKRTYKSKEYKLIKRDVRVGDIILLNYGTKFELIEEIHSKNDLNYISGWTNAIVNKEYYVLEIL